MSTVSVTLLIVVALFIILLLLYLGVKLVRKEHIFSRDRMASMCPQKLLIKGIIRQSNKLQEHEKNAQQWRHFNYPIGNSTMAIPYVHIVKENPTDTLVICHGAAYELEYCFKEYKKISDAYNVSIVSVEYPGFGQRGHEKLTENALLKTYPQEVLYLINDHLQIDWKNISILGQCLGAPIALRIAAQPCVSKKIKHLYLTKPWSSLHTALKGVTSTRLIKHITRLIPDLFETDETITSKIYAPVKCVQGDADLVCQKQDTQKLLDKMTNAKTREMYLLPGDGHTVLMVKMFEFMQTSSPQHS